MSVSRGFVSDNCAGVHPDIMSALIKANQGHAPSYGEDSLSIHVIDLFRKHFGPVAETFFAFNGTGANVTALYTLGRPYESVVCAASSHIYKDECGAVEKITGSRLVAIPTADGKLTPEILDLFVSTDRDPHSIQPRVLSLAQSTELGTVYSPAEIQAVAEWAHARDMFVYLDGARLANAAVALDVELADLTTHVGVDALSFGGTKNGMMFGEAVVFLRPGLANSFPYIRQQCAQSASKSRFIAAQFEVMIGTDLWRRNASHANRMAKRLRDAVIGLPGLSVSRPVQANAVFAVLPSNVITILQANDPFQVWNPLTGEVRWMCAFDTTPEDVDTFAASVALALTEAGSVDTGRVRMQTSPSDQDD